jgi:hypothetical protein
MTYAIGAGEAIHDPGAVVRGMFADMGWTTAPNCSYTLSTSAVNIGPSAGAGTVNVTAPAGCAWTAVSSAAFASITGGASGNGNGTVSDVVSANTGGSRSGTLTIGGKVFTIAQGARARTGDFSGDGRSDVTVFRPSTGIWYVRNIVTGLYEFFQWGLSEDVPVQGDYDGDGKADMAVFRPSTSIWYVRNSSNGSSAFLQWGSRGHPVPGTTTAMASTTARCSGRRRASGTCGIW